MRLEPDAGADGNVVDTFGNLLAGGVGRQFVALRIEITRRGNGRRRARNEFIRPLQVLVAVQGLVNVVGIGCVVSGVRSEERRVGKDGVSTCRSRWSPYH